MRAAAERRKVVETGRSVLRWRMTTKGIEHFPQPEDWSEEALRQIGYRRVAISIFDHWLTRDEWLRSPFVSLERARANGLASTFCEQSLRYRNFYHNILSDGAFRLTGSKLRPQVAWHAGWDRRLKKAVTAMVEDRSWGSEFYAPASHVRFISADDRTDTVLLEDGADEQAIRKLAASQGLHLIG